MVTVKRFGVLSVGIISGIISAIGGLIAGMMMAGMVSLVPLYEDIYGDLGAFGWIFGGMALFFFPVIYGAFGFIGGIITAALYNLFTRWVGGIQLEIKSENPGN